MADYPISKEAVVRELINLRDALGGPFAKEIMNMALAKLEGFKRMDAVPVVHGRWVLGVPITCSVCGKPAAEHDSPITFWESPYCPWCGAKMDGGSE